MPNPKLETYKSKKTGVIYDYTDADAQSQLTGIKDGTSIDSFADVETALAGCVDWSSYAVTGVHQMLPLTLDYIKALNSGRTWNGNSCTHNGITFTINTDSKGRVISITKSGIATGFAFLRISGLSSFSGNFILNGGKDVGNMVYIQNETTSTQIAVSTGNDAPITLSPTANIINCIIGVNQGTSDEQTFFPMLRLASDTDATYTPYAMTNRELTESVTPVLGTVTSDFTVNSSTRLYKVGKVVHAALTIEGITKSAWTAGLFEIPQGFRPVAFTVVPAIVDTATPCRCMIDTSGNVQSSIGLENKTLFINATWITA